MFDDRLHKYYNRRHVLAFELLRTLILQNYRIKTLKLVVPEGFQLLPLTCCCCCFWKRGGIALWCR